MKALIFAAGIGSRLKPWTDSHPKALVEVGGKPMLGRVIDNIIAAGISDIIVNVHHFSGQIVDYINNTEFKARITISDEPDLLLDTGGGLRKVLPLLGNEPVLIHNADILTTFDLKKIIYRQARSGADVTLLTQERNSSRRLVFGRDDRLRGWTNLNTGEMKPAGLAITAGMKLESFDGIHIVDSSMYDSLKKFRGAGKPFSIIDFYLAMCPDWKIMSMSLSDDDHWFDVGKPETLQRARNFYSNSK